MNQVSEFFRKLLDTADFPPRWHCGQWSEFHGWLYIVSDLLIWGAYFAIPLIILRYITRKHNARFHKVYFLFAAFILACGATHFLDAVIFWFPVYRLSAVVRLFTAIVSWATVFMLIRLLPKAFSLKTAEELEAEVEQRKKAEGQLRINNELLNEAQEIAKLGHWQWDVVNNRLTWSDALYKVYGADKSVELTYQSFIERIHPEDREYVQHNIQSAFEKKEFPEFYHRIILDDGTVKTMHSKGEVITDSEGNVVKMIGTGQDVTALKKKEQELLVKSQELEAVNIELQKFASIASHDLREPLRKIMTFASLLEKEFHDNLGERGRNYIEKMSGSARRMQLLIDDILDYSQLTGVQQTYAKVNLKVLIDEILSDMEVTIATTEATVNVGEMPTIEGNAMQLRQLFQNLISNAIKFTKPHQKPQVDIDCEMISGTQLPKEYLESTRHEFSILSNPVFWENERFCKITVKDNGIGFEEQYLDKVFAIFQRLHSKSEYEGTGIGLAICKKVVDLHHGMITAYSKPNEGAAFIIILPCFQQSFHEIADASH